MSNSDPLEKFRLPSPTFLRSLSTEGLTEALSLSLDYFRDGRARPQGESTAAVTLLIRRIEHLPEVLMIRRPGGPDDPAERHPGQIAFPGGRLDPEDQGEGRVAALRELAEEVGISEGIQVIGALPRLLTGASAHVLEPWVARLQESSADLKIQETEVTEARWVPLLSLVSDGIYLREWLERPAGPGRARIKFEMPVFDLRAQLGEQWRVWGATALILENFLRRLERAENLTGGGLGP